MDLLARVPGMPVTPQSSGLKTSLAIHWHSAQRGWKSQSIRADPPPILGRADVAVQLRTQSLDRPGPIAWGCFLPCCCRVITLYYAEQFFVDAPRPPSANCLKTFCGKLNCKSRVGARDISQNDSTPPKTIFSVLSRHRGVVSAVIGIMSFQLMQEVHR